MLEEDIKEDWKYYSKTVEVYRVKTADKTFYISKNQASVLKKVVEDIEHKDRMVFIGDDGIRAFSILAILKEQKKFYELPTSLQKKLLEEEKVFTDKEMAGFSKHIRDRLDNSKKFLLEG